ncbi:amidase [Hoeflea sp.]|uniref:amidase n=1 Tax=Hoeflea sp. TaxID=1940281 RepID=UPI003B02814F
MNGEPQTSAVERVESAIEKIRADNDRLCIVTALDTDGAMRAASESDARHAAGAALGPLDGQTLAIKDNIAVADMPWTAGLGAWRDRTAGTESPVVARLRAAGAIPLAMVNMHEGALGATTDNPHYGRTRNPLDPERTPGGSSGGSAAAIAAGFTDVALGSDTMGSVRIPAAYCGLTGLKPTRGLVPRTGTTHLSPTLDAIGPLARDVATLRELILVMAGPDRGDPLSVGLPQDWHSRRPDADLARLCIGVPKQIGEVDCEPQILGGLEQSKSGLAHLGCTVVDIDLEGWSPGHARRGGLLVAEAEGAVELAEALAQPGPEAVSDELRALMDYGRALTSDRLTAGYIRIQQAAAAAARAFSEVDVILMPTAPQRAFPHDVPAPANQADFTSLANFYGGPALAVPVPADGLPASVQLVGRPFAEPMLMTLGADLQALVAAN